MATYFCYIVLSFFASIGVIAVLFLIFQMFLLRGRGGDIVLCIPLRQGQCTLERDMQRVFYSNLPVLYDKILLIDRGADRETAELAEYYALMYPAVFFVREEDALWRKIDDGQ